MADRSLGKVMMIPKGAYNATSIYNKLDFVIDDGTSYVALEDNITNKKPKDNPTKWQILASGIAVVSEEHTYAAQSQAQYTGEPPATGWQQTIPEAIPGGYLWTKTVITYENQQTTTNYSLVKNGQNGIATAEDVSFDPDFAYSSGTVGKELTEQSSQISDINTKLGDIVASGAGAHNAIYRGKNLGTSVTAAQWAAIQAGTFDDLFIGDYWVIGGVNWRIAAFDYWYNYGDTQCTTHHVVIVPDSNLLNGDGSTTHWMNKTDITTGAYVGSDFYTGNNGNTGKSQCRTKIQNAFGSGHILTHREYLKSAVANGYESAGAWYDSDLEMMTEQMVYGGRVFGNIANGTIVPECHTIDQTQLPLFALDRSKICNRAGWWLRDVVSSSNFARVSDSGNANYNGASDTWRGVRPAFGIC